MSEFKPSLFPELLKDLKSLSFTTGIFPSQRIRRLIEDSRIWADGGIDESQIQPSSIDLRLGSVAYRVQASFLPGKNWTVDAKAKDLIMTEIDLTRPTVFEKGCVYIVPLMERVHLPADVSAKANPKSTTGRLDIFTRLSEEWQRARKWLGAITGNAELLADNPTLARSIRNRFPYLDPLNHVQVELLRRYRAGDRDERLLRVIHLTINGLAAGLRNSG